MEKQDFNCRNPKCDGTKMQTVEGFHALTKVTKTDKGLAFHPSSGIVCNAFYCPNCYELRIFPAAALDPTFFDKK
jgi:hypothetical protein